MTDYVKSTNFASKDSLPAGSSLKIVKGTEIDNEFNNIATAVATKLDTIQSSLSANQVLHLNSSKTVTGSSKLTFNGSLFTATANMLLNNTDNTANSYSSLSFKTFYVPTGSANYNTNGSISFYSKDQLGNEGLGASITHTNLTYNFSSTFSGGKLYLAAYANTSGVESVRSYLSMEAVGTTQLYGASGLTFTAASNYTHIFNNGSTTYLTLDSVGNLGLGSTPSAWSSSFNAFQVKRAGLSSSGSTAYVSANAYFTTSPSTSWRAISSGASFLYSMESGAHTWSYSSSGTAGGAITLGALMSLAGSTGVLTLYNYSGTGNRALYVDGDGNVTTSSSDRTLKKDDKEIEQGLAAVAAMRPISFKWIDEQKMGSQREIGFIAQEMKEIVPEVIGANRDGTLSLDYPKLTAVLVKAIQELKAEVDSLKAGK